MAHGQYNVYIKSYYDTEYNLIENVKRKKKGKNKLGRTSCVVTLAQLW